MIVLGINAWHGDASAAIMVNGNVVLAIEEERLNRKKHCAGFPTLAIKACLDAANVHISDVDHIAISTDPSANLKDKIFYALKRVTKIHKMLLDRVGKTLKNKDLSVILAEALQVPQSDIKAKIHRIEHHLAHIATAYYASPFKKAAVLTLDGMGDFVSAKWGKAINGQIEISGQVEYPHSIGYLYTAVTQYLGFPYYGDEGKIMGLAPYGKPIYIDLFRDMITTPEQALGYELNLRYFVHHEQGIHMQWEDGQPMVGKLFSDYMEQKLGPAREPGTPYTSHHENVAASLQLRVEEVCHDMMRKLHALTGLDTLCLAGGVALNSVMNGKIRLQTPFKEVYIHPNAGDGGTSLGAAQWVYHQVLEHNEWQPIEHAYLGSEFSDSQIEQAIHDAGLKFEKLTFTNLYHHAAQSIADGLVVGWFQGKMEWGPRALGNRSIVADPRRGDMKDILNARIKKREPFRPFAPSVLEEETASWFEQSYPSPTMLMVYQVKKNKRERVPAITHVDGSGRLQTVRHEHNERYYNLIKAFHKLTGVPMVLNTSFNENEPVVCTPQEAIDCFVRTKMDRLYIGTYHILK